MNDNSDTFECFYALSPLLHKIAYHWHVIIKSTTTNID